MFRLTIRKANDSVYWVEHFNSMNELNRWLTTEKTRSYWVNTYTTEVADLRKPIDPVDEAERIAKEKKRSEAQARLESIDWEKVKTVADVKAVVKDLLDKF